MFSNTQQYISKKEAQQLRDRLKDNAYRMDIDREPVEGDLSAFYYNREFGIIDKNETAQTAKEILIQNQKLTRPPLEKIKVTQEFYEHLDKKEAEYDKVNPITSDGKRAVFEIVESSASASFQSSEDEKVQKKQTINKLDNLDPTRENLKFRTMAKYKAI